MTAQVILLSEERQRRMDKLILESLLTIVPESPAEAAFLNFFLGRVEEIHARPTSDTYPPPP